MEQFIEEKDEKILSLAETFEKAGGELDFIFLTLKNNKEKDHFSLSQKAVVHAMTILAGRLDEQYLVYLKLSKEERNKLFKIIIYDREPPGKQISLTEFYGPFFDEKKKMLLFPGKTIRNKNICFFPGQAGNTENGLCVDTRPFRELYTYHTTGYAQAFFSPPYNLKISDNEINTLFLSFNNMIFRGDIPYIVFWDNNWSNYFDKGKSWWGGYMWSLLFMQSSRCVVIGASAID